MPIRKRYDKNHWIRSQDQDRALEAYLDQQSKVYSQVKNSFVSELLGDLKGKSVLDYGCGGGYFAVHAAAQGARSILAVDAEEQVLATARKFAQQEGVVESIQFLHSETFPRFPLNTGFDVVIIKDVLEHVSDDERLIESAASVLNPDGALIISTQNSMSLNFLIEGGYKRYVKGRNEWCGWDETHVRFYTPFSLGRKLNNAGLRPDKWRSVYIVPHKIPTATGAKKQFVRVNAIAWADRILGAMFPFNHLGWNLIVRAKKSPMAPKIAPIATVKAKAPIPGPVASIACGALENK